MTDLAACPFCGKSKAMMLPPTCKRETPYNPADRLFPIVRCMNCYAEVVGDNEDQRGQSAVTAWNRRSLPSPGGEWPPSPDGVVTYTVTASVYEAAVKGRAAFRRAFATQRPVIKAARALRDKWRTKGQKVDGDDFFAAIHAVSEAIDAMDAP